MGDDTDEEEFYDFTEDIHVPECQVTFSGSTRHLQNICLLPNRHLLIEGGIMDEIVEVY